VGVRGGVKAKKMRPLYATAPSDSLNLPDQKKTSRLEQGLWLLANYFSDARLAQELFDTE
jgi:hypothetical protein